MALLDDILTRLIDASDGVGVDPGAGDFTASQWPIYTGFLPDIQDQSIAIIELPGSPAEPKWKIIYPDFMIIVRGAKNGYADARTKIDDVFEQLHDNHAQVGANYILILSDQSGPSSWGEDSLDRPRFSWNFKVIKDR